MKVVDRLLRNIKSQQGRLLFFSQSTKVLDLVQNYVVAEGYSFLRMDGSTSRKKRDECVESFKKNDDAFIFLLSTRAMGIGLNLTAANFVIIFDVEWNPSNDAQAQDRVYRIGQERNVTVFRLVCRGTVEEQKYMRQVYKKQLKSETIMEDVEVDRNTAVRFFRGVAGDKYRKGELFGFVNLIKFDSRGTFLNYAEKGAGSSRYGEGVIKNSNVLEVIKERHESLEEDDTFDLLEGLARTHKDIATRTTEGKHIEFFYIFVGVRGSFNIVFDSFSLLQIVILWGRMTSKSRLWEVKVK
jgi:superfamily II DNA/RNA helicase